MLRCGLLLGMVISTLLLSACQAPANKPYNGLSGQTSGAENCPTQKINDKALCIWLHEMRWRLQRNFFDAEHYHGLTCQVTTEYTRGRYKVVRTQGDEPLCLKAWSVIGTAEGLPPPPDSVPRTLTFDFQPTHS